MDDDTIEVCRLCQQPGSRPAHLATSRYVQTLGTMELRTTLKQRQEPTTYRDRPEADACLTAGAISKCQ
jgi:hypothetical protein